jgi:hypothetical protein
VTEGEGVLVANSLICGFLQTSDLQLSRTVISFKQGQGKLIST